MSLRNIKNIFLILVFSFLVLPSVIFAQIKEPKTVRDYFMLLPDKYFQVLCCEDDTKESYLKMFLDVEDTANGYMKSNAEAGQGGFEMALFKRPNGTYIIGLYTFGEVWDDFYFLEYRGGKWFDISKKLVPDYGKYRWYELPRYGTTVKVNRRDVDEVASEDDIIISSKGAKLYDLVWMNGKFFIQK